MKDSSEPSPMIIGFGGGFIGVGMATIALTQLPESVISPYLHSTAFIMLGLIFIITEMYFARQEK